MCIQVTFVSSRDQLPGLAESSSKANWNKNSTWYSIKEQDKNMFAFEVQTADHGYNSGRSYYFGTQTKEARSVWVSRLQDAVMACKKRKLAEENSKLAMAQIRCKRFYDSTFLQGVVAFLIFGNFVANVAQSEMQPTPGSSADSSFTSLDTFFTGLHHISENAPLPFLHVNFQSAIFALELCINLFSNWFWPFFTDGWSVRFDNFLTGKIRDLQVDDGGSFRSVSIS